MQPANQPANQPGASSYPSAPGGRQEIPSLVGVRAVAAGWVVLFHLGGYGLFDALPALRPARFLIERGYLGVDLFFILSGFIIAYCYAGTFGRLRPEVYRRFLLLRLSRIYPVHLLTLTLVVVTVGLPLLCGSPPRDPSRYSAPKLLLNLTLLHAWGLSPGMSFNEPAWSISAEWFAYLCFPLVAAVLRRVRRPLAAVLLAMLPILLIDLLRRTQGWQSFNLTPRHGFMPLCRVLGEFTAGALLCRLTQLVPAAPRLYARLATACALALLVCAAALDGDVVLVLLMGALIFALALARGGLADLLGRPLMHFWGRASYSLYMVHLLIIPTVYKAAALLRVPTDSALPLLLALACLLAVSSIVYLRVEETARLRLRRVIGSPG